ncbi:hypothetical protein [Haloarcula rubripromontorii]|uniref:hypothetical protein n=1 Tax=Haloarcula rubripromontorii TaxID=1705562 RepID=UPI0006B61C83|nr:hypothetical protein [Haloarcula rubripromontorii]
MDENGDDWDWLTDMDFEILEVMRFELILSPSIIAENIGRSREGVSNRLNSMQAGGLIEKLDRGKYRITDDGLRVWKQADGSQYEKRRLEVTERKQIHRELGVSLEEYHEEVQKEYEKIQQSNQNSDMDDDLLELAFERARERLQEEHE